MINGQGLHNFLQRQIFFLLLLDLQGNPSITKGEQVLEQKKGGQEIEESFKIFILIF